VHIPETYKCVFVPYFSGERL